MSGRSAELLFGLCLPAAFGVGILLNALINLHDHRFWAFRFVEGIIILLAFWATYGEIRMVLDGAYPTLIFVLVLAFCFFFQVPLHFIGQRLGKESNAQ